MGRKSTEQLLIEKIHNLDIEKNKLKEENEKILFKYEELLFKYEHRVTE